MPRTAGTLALGSVVCLFVPLIAVSTAGEPPFDATPAEAADFFSQTHTAWAAAAGVTAAIGMLVFLWFVAALFWLLRQLEGDPAWRSTVALGSGLVMAAYGILDAHWGAATNRGADLDPALAIFAFDLGNIGFANAWLALGSFGIATGWVLVRSRAVHVLWGWWAIVGGVGLICVRYFWAGYIWFAPYAVFWLWVIGFGIRLVSRPELSEGQSAEPSA